MMIGSSWRVRAMASAGSVIAALSYVVASAPAAHAFNATSYPYPLTVALPVATTSQMVTAQGRLFVTQGAGHSDVQVYSTAGALLHDISGEPEASSMALSPDGRTLYVADVPAPGDGEISAIDTATLAHTDVVSDPCPTNLVAAAGRVFYSYGCQLAADTSGVASVDPTSTAAPVEAFTGLSTPPVVRGGGDVVVVLPRGTGKRTITSYGADPSGALTAMSSMPERGNPLSSATSGDGSHIVMFASALHFVEYSTATFATEKSFATDQFDGSMQLSVDGRYLLVGPPDQDSSTMSLYSTSKTNPLWIREASGTMPSTWEYGTSAYPVPGSVTFSPTDSHVYALVAAQSGGVYLFDSAPTTSRSTLHVSFRNKDFLSQVKNLGVKLSTAGTVTIYKYRQHQQPRLVRSVTTNAQGLAAVKVKLFYSSTLEFVYDGGVASYPTSYFLPLGAPARIRVSLRGSYRTRHHVQLLHHASDAQFGAVMTPVVSKHRKLRLQLQRQQNGHWRIVGTARGLTDATGTDTFALSHVRKQTLYRVRVYFRGDLDNTESIGLSRSFEIT
jgi:hypothetical protein